MGVPEDIARLEQDVRELIIKYEQYFFGIEKREPLKLLDEVERLARRYQNVSITKTRDKFKYDSIVATLGVHKQKWGRINRLIEEGKYERNRLAKPPGSKASRHETPKQDEMERVYQQYITARRACNLSVENISPEKIAAAIERQKPEIMKKYHCSDVDLVVVIEGGKPRLKARPKSASNS